MIADLEIQSDTSWLDSINSSTIPAILPIHQILAHSLYYPAAGLDGDPIAYLAGNYLSFVYVDYGISRAVLLNTLSERGFRGYSIVAQRPVTQRELIPNGWTNHTVSKNIPVGIVGADQITPFCEWIIFQRSDEYDIRHGPERFSLLYMCADGVATFEALYVSNSTAPEAIAIVQPGHSFGGNWTNFADPDQSLHEVVLNNPHGYPTVLLYGGSGGTAPYTKPCWPEYSIGMGFLGNTSISVWRRKGVMR